MESNIRNLTYTNDLFRENLELLISEKGETKKSIADIVGTSETNFSRLCRKDNLQLPSIEVLMRIAKYFNVTIDELISECIKEKREAQKVANERKDIKFCEKLINETNENLIPWKGYMGPESSDICDEIFSISPYEEYISYHNAELGIERNVAELRVAYAKLNEINALRPKIEICVVEIPFNIEDKELLYEIYFKKDGGEVIKAGSSYVDRFLNIEIDRDFQAVMEKLHASIEYYIVFGKERFERDKLFDEYLNDGNIPDDVAF